MNRRTALSRRALVVGGAAASAALALPGCARADTPPTRRIGFALVRYTKATAERDSRLEGRVSVLESRVDKLESK